MNSANQPVERTGTSRFRQRTLAAQQRLVPAAPRQRWDSATVMRVLISLPALAMVVASCEPSERLLFPQSPFPPKTEAELRRWVEAFAPIEIASATNIKGARVRRVSATYSNLESFFFAFQCSSGEADRVVRRESARDNSVFVEPSRVIVKVDAEESAKRPEIMPSRFPAEPIFPDVFYEGYDLSNCSVLQIRLNGAPEWFNPHLMKRGLASRCVWRRGQVHSEAYYDADRKTMFLRFDLLRPG